MAATMPDPSRARTRRRVRARGRRIVAAVTASTHTTPHRIARPSSMLLLVLALAGCKTDEDGQEFGNVPQSEGPATYANFYCDVLAACDCNFPTSGDACVSAATSQFQSAFDEAAAAGLTYHGECLGDYLEYIDSLGCATISALIADPDFAEFDIYGCKVFSGTAAEGEPCMAYYEVFGDSCQQGLACFGDTCTMISTTPPPTKAIGETCDPQSEVCEEGGLCTTVDGTTYTCVALPVEGESCMQTGLCAEPAWCDYGDYLCKAPVGEGEACDLGGPNCAANLFCNDETLICEPLKADGEGCSSDEQCAAGLVCDEPAEDGAGDVCQPEGPLVCGGL
jgi:hypothetical protein